MPAPDRQPDSTDAEYIAYLQRAREAATADNCRLRDLIMLKDAVIAELRAQLEIARVKINR